MNLDVNHQSGSQAASGINSMPTEMPAAVWGRSVNKSYGRGSNRINVLNDLDITVPRGCIYGLLGPSGCGKTTLLRSAIGRLHLDSGHMIVLGDRPGARGHKVPGRMVGYMPQETALFPDLTISETLKYFGTLNGMSSEYINTRMDFLISFLTLPNKGRLVGQLSGGQMRRVSFSVALLHEPELLILDEPTVGVDPLLRERIWDHLINITSHTGSHTTIILTTHYIEEARQADKVGFMRNGRILAEEKPSTVIEKYKMNSLENVFLKLCQDDREGTPPDLALPPDENSDSSINVEFDEASSKHADGDEDHTPLLDTVSSLYEPITHSSRFSSPCGFPSCRNIIAQFIKNLRLMKRNYGFMFFQFMSPLVQIVLFCVCIGNDPFNLHMAVINNDTGIPLLGTNLGEQFLHAIDNYTITQENYTRRGYSEAIRSVEQTKTWGLISIGQNFSVDLIQRFQGGNISDAVLNGSSIKLKLDTTNEQVAIILMQKITDAFELFAADMLKQYKMNPKLASLPVEMVKPVYGDADATFTEFMAPGIIISITFFLATGLTTLAFVIDKKNGMLDRCLATGMVSFEIMLAHMFTQMLVVIVQVTVLLVFVLIVFHVPCKGPLVWVIVLVLIQGFCGMALGVLYSAFCSDENSAIQLALGSFFPLLLLSGIIWPVEAIPTWLRYISYCSPLTYACDAMRCILARGLDMTFFAVWRGYLVSLGWCSGLVILGGIVLKLKE